MIKHFGSLYAGHVDLGDLGLEATAVNDRRFDNDHLITIFDRCEQMAKLMDRLGYHSFWGAEHHFQHEGNEVIPNLLMLFVHLARMTKQLKFGCGFNINPMWHPLRLAEDYATADILTDGRVIFGVGRGYHSREVDTFGVPSTNSDNEMNREIFEEQVEIILKSFHEDSFSYQGKHYQLPPEVPYRGYTLKELTLVPRPKYQPVEVWQPMVSSSPRALEFMAKHDIQGIMGGGAVTGGTNDDVITRWTEAVNRHGHNVEPGGRLVIGLPTFIADSEKEAIEQGRKYLEEDMKMFAPLGFFRALSESQIEALGDPRRAQGRGPADDGGHRGAGGLAGGHRRAGDREDQGHRGALPWFGAHARRLQPHGGAAGGHAGAAAALRRGGHAPLRHRGEAAGVGLRLECRCWRAGPGK